MVAFAANSLLARAALVQTAIDPATFSSVRLISGAVFLLLFVVVRYRKLPFEAGSWWSALVLFVYAAAFSYAYTQLSAGTGALILFGSVQVTMLIVGFAKGDRFSPLQWLGFALACIGVAYLLLPGVNAPAFLGALSGTLLMTLAGVAWGVYTLRAGSADPVLTSASNFARTIPMCLLLAVVAHRSMAVDDLGLIYAVVSGAITSGLGYVVWYRVLPNLRVVNAATVQLSVPAIAAVMGVVLLGEPMTARLVAAAIAILIGIAIVLRFKPA
jgi:drug/metabolite transporter (DMT)-like permease